VTAYARQLAAAALVTTVIGGCGSGDAESRSEVPRAPRGFHQVMAPTGEPSGVVLTIHGGGWQWVGEPMAHTEDGNAARFAAAGWLALNVDYRPGRKSVTDVAAWYDWAARRWPGLPICAAGSSAGAHLALMVAVRRPGVRCVIGFGAITNLSTLRGTAKTDELRRDFVLPSFGAAQLRRYSPIRAAERVRARVLLLTSRKDPWAPCSQIRAWARRDTDARSVCVPAGDEPFVHANVSAAALRIRDEAEQELLAGVAAD